MSVSTIKLPTIDAELGTIRQIAYIVDDIDAAMQEWREQQGVKAFLVTRNAKPLANATYRGEPMQTAVLDIAFGYLGDLQVELIELKNGVPSMYKEAIDRGQKDLQHYGITVEDFDKAYQYASDKGFVSVIDAGIAGLARMSYMEATDFGQSVFNDTAFMQTPEGHGIVLEVIEWNAMTRPYFDSIETMVKQIPDGQLYQEFDLKSITPIGAVLRKLPGFLWKKLRGKV